MITTSSTTTPLRSRFGEVASWTLGVFLLITTLYGLLAEHAYRLDRRLELESIAQDALTLATVPVLIWAGRRSRTSLRAHLLWLGLLSYLAYTYFIYAVGVPQNQVFLLYTAILGLAVAALVDGIGRIDVHVTAPAFHRSDDRGIGWFLIAVGCAFAALWLVDLIPSVWGSLPSTSGVGGLPYPVYVADLAFTLPAVVATGAALVRGHVAAPVLGAVVLVKIVTMGLAIWAMAIAILVDGGVPDWPVAGLFAVMIAVCATVLVCGARRLGHPARHWLRPTLWQR